MFQNKVGYKYPGKTTELSQRAIDNIKNYYQNDYVILDRLLEIGLIDQDYREACNKYRQSI